MSPTGATASVAGGLFSSVVGDGGGGAGGGARGGAASSSVLATAAESVAAAEVGAFGSAAHAGGDDVTGAALAADAQSEYEAVAAALAAGGGPSGIGSGDYSEGLSAFCGLAASKGGDELGKNVEAALRNAPARRREVVRFWWARAFAAYLAVLISLNAVPTAGGPPQVAEPLASAWAAAGLFELVGRGGAGQNEPLRFVNAADGAVTPSWSCAAWGIPAPTGAAVAPEPAEYMGVHAGVAIIMNNPVATVMMEALRGHG